MPISKACSSAWQYVNGKFNLQSVGLKLQAVKRGLKKLHRVKSGKAHEKLEHLRKKMEEIHCQRDFDVDETTQMIEKEKITSRGTLDFLPFKY